MAGAINWLMAGAINWLMDIDGKIVTQIDTKPRTM